MFRRCHDEMLVALPGVHYRGCILLPNYGGGNVHRHISVFNAQADEDHWPFLKYHVRLCECHNSGYSADGG